MPATGGYVEITSELDLLGGEAANTALCLMAWGVPIQFFGNPLGDDTEGELLLRLAEEKGLPTESLQRTAPRTTLCDIYVTPDGERTMIGTGFSEMGQYVSLEKLPLIPGAWFTADPNFGPNARIAARKAIDAGMKMYLMDYIQEDDPVAEGSFWQTSTDWTGTKGDFSATVDWAKRWSGRFGCHTIVSDSSVGLAYSSPSSKGAKLPVYPCPLALDSTGAGDSFRAGMLYGLDIDKPLHECFAFASASGCLACGYLGATSGTPQLADIVALMEANPDIVNAYGEALL